MSDTVLRSKVRNKGVKPQKSFWAMLYSTGLARLAVKENFEVEVTET